MHTKYMDTITKRHRNRITRYRRLVKQATAAEGVYVSPKYRDKVDRLRAKLAAAEAVAERMGIEV